MPTQTLSQTAYSDFVKQVETGKIQTVTLKPQRIEYRLKITFGGKRFYTCLPETKTTEDLKALLRQHRVALTDLSNNQTAFAIASLLLSTTALAGAFAWLTKSGNLGDNPFNNIGVGRSKVKEYSRSTTAKNKQKGTITFADVAGVDEAKQDLK